MTIHEIKARTQETSPYFFNRNTMKFFNQTMSSFKVKKQANGTFLICAPMKDNTGSLIGQTKRYFCPLTNTLNHSNN